MKYGKRLLKKEFEIQKYEYLNLEFKQIKKQPKTKQEIRTKVNIVLPNGDRDRDVNKKLF